MVGGRSPRASSFHSILTPRHGTSRRAWWWRMRRWCCVAAKNKSPRGGPIPERARSILGRVRAAGFVIGVARRLASVWPRGPQRRRCDLGAGADCGVPCRRKGADRAMLQTSPLQRLADAGGDPGQGHRTGLGGLFKAEPPAPSGYATFRDKGLSRGNKIPAELYRSIDIWRSD